MAIRQHANRNPRAFFYETPLTLEDHQNSRWVVEPLHLFDCCLENDGAGALVLVSAERAKTLKKPPAYVRAATMNGYSKDRHYGDTAATSTGPASVQDGRACRPRTWTWCRSTTTSVRT